MAGEWREVAIGTLVQFIRGRRLPKSLRRVNGTVPVYGAGGIVGFHDAALTDGPTLILGATGSKAGAVFYSSVPCWPIDTTVYLTTSDPWRTRYVSYLLRSVGMEAMIDEAVIPHLDLRAIRARIVRIPNDEREQRAIAHILGTLDDKIELNRRMSETLQQMAREIFKAWFVDFEPVRANMEGRWRPSEFLPGFPVNLYELFPERLVASDLGPIPEGWRVGTIRELADTIRGSTPRTNVPAYWHGGTHYWATTRDLARLRLPVLLTTERKITDAGLGQMRSGLCPRGIVLLSLKASIGHAAIADVPVAIGDGVIAMRPKDGVSNLWLLLWAQCARDELSSRANGTTVAGIPAASFSTIPVVVPPEAIMKAFDDYVRPLYERLIACVRESCTVAELRDGLLPKLIRGEIRVNDLTRGLCRDREPSALLRPHSDRHAVLF